MLKKIKSTFLLFIGFIVVLAIYFGGIAMLKIPAVGVYIVYAALAAEIAVVIKWNSFQKWANKNKTVLKLRQIFKKYFDSINH